MTQAQQAQHQSVSSMAISAFLRQSKPLTRDCTPSMNSSLYATPSRIFLSALLATSSTHAIATDYKCTHKQEHRTQEDVDIYRIENGRAWLWSDVQGKWLDQCTSDTTTARQCSMSNNFLVITYRSRIPSGNIENDRFSSNFHLSTGEFYTEVGMRTWSEGSCKEI